MSSWYFSARWWRNGSNCTRPAVGRLRQWDRAFRKPMTFATQSRRRAWRNSLRSTRCATPSSRAWTLLICRSKPGRHCAVAFACAINRNRVSPIRTQACNIQQHCAITTSLGVARHTCHMFYSVSPNLASKAARSSAQAWRSCSKVVSRCAAWYGATQQ